MNTRIQELMKQATYIVKGANGCVWGNNVNLEKFAELIVRECAQIADKAWAAPGYQIKQHFGVEA
jgi:hypothetical protein